jgi:arabinofuranosyltransferase
MFKSAKSAPLNRIFSKSSWPIWILAAIYIILSTSYSFICDDAFITFRVARNLASGLGPVFNAGERVEGYTSFLWMILMAFVIRLGGAPQIWSRIFSIAFSAGTVLLFFRSINYDPGFSKYLFTIFLVFSAPFIAWSTGGLETAAFAFFVFAAAMLFRDAYERKASKSFLLSSLLFCLAALTRPEGVPIFAVLAAFLVFFASTGKSSFRQVMSFLLPFTILYGAYFLWRYGYYGRFLPNTYYVKSLRASMLRLGISYSWHFLVHSAPWIPLFVVAHRIFRSKKYIFRDIEIAILAILSLYSIYIIFIGGDFMALYRFYMPLLPLTYFLFHRLYWNAGNSTYQTRISPFVLGALAIFISINAYSGLKSKGDNHSYNLDSIGRMETYCDQWSRIGRFIAVNSRPSDTIAVTAVGAIPYYSGLYTIDMLGLEARDLSKYESAQIPGGPGHMISLATKYLLEARPQFIIGHPGIIKKSAGQFSFSDSQSSSDYSRGGYTPAAAQIPGRPGYLWRFWIRNDITDRVSGDIELYQSNPAFKDSAELRIFR